MIRRATGIWRYNQARIILGRSISFYCTALSAIGSCIYLNLQCPNHNAASVAVRAMSVPSKSASEYHRVGADGELYRHDGVRIVHDPYDPAMVEKYGAPGVTDGEGFDPYRDTVGPGIYGGIVKRDVRGEVVVGRQYQNHNPRPGPVYAGGGYAPSAAALDDVEGTLIPLLERHPDLANDVTTGGASPLHMCGMSRRNQGAVTVLVRYGADVEALDTYGMTPLHRMASNDLAEGARLLLEAGADPENTGEIGTTPEQMARESRANGVLAVLTSLDKNPSLAQRRKGRSADNVVRLEVRDAGRVVEVNGIYHRTSPDEIPRSFAKVCHDQRWNVADTWRRLNGDEAAWYKHSDPNNGSYVYRNLSDGKWWIDGPDGLGAYIAKGGANAPPSRGWKPIGGGAGGRTERTTAASERLPNLLIFRYVGGGEKDHTTKHAKE